MTVFSNRARWEAAVNPISTALAARRRLGQQIIDLTVTNPTRVGIAYPDEELSAAMAFAARARYDPHPLGLASAREALAATWSDEGQVVDPDDLVLTASTSEAYSFLFKLLCNSGEEIVVHTPSYPLLDHLAALEEVELQRIPLRHTGRWAFGESELESSLSDRTRALVVIHPNNPTGSYLRPDEQNRIVQHLRSRTLPLISDEVFYDYRIEEEIPAAPPAASREDLLTFSLGGLSKSAGLPHWKLGWIRVGGPRSERRRAVEALEWITDTFLSVATPVQIALPQILRIAPEIRAGIMTRIRENLDRIRRHLAGCSSLRLLPVEGGWSAVLRVPCLPGCEPALDLLVSKGVLVHPGFFYDFDREGYLVVSLLTPPAAMDRGLRGIIERVEELGLAE